jgi:hypothetical protein
MAWGDAMKTLLGLCAVVVLAFATYDAADARKSGWGSSRSYSAPRVRGYSAPRVRSYSTPRVRAARSYTPRVRTSTRVRSATAKSNASGLGPSTATHSYVRGYFRKDGKYVKPHWAKKPRRRDDPPPIVSRAPAVTAPALSSPIGRPPARLGPIY